MNKGFLPLPLRCLFVGTSGCGKTTLLYNLIIKPWGIPFYYLYIFSKSLEQEIYQKLKNVYEKLSVEEGTQMVHFFNSCE
jgi:predicted AAA+ superfamily ATPase